jgi:hypothetical protein
MALCASCGKQDDKNPAGAKITASVFLKAVSKMRSTAEGDDGLDGKSWYNLTSDESGKVLLYQAAMCLMEEVCKYMNEMGGKTALYSCCGVVHDEIVPNPQRL